MTGSRGGGKTASIAYKFYEQLQRAEALLADIQHGRLPVEGSPGNVTAAIRSYFNQHERLEMMRGTSAPKSKA